MPLPRAPGPIDMVPSLQDLGTPGFSAGAVGNGQTNPITLPLSKISDHDGDMEGPEPQTSSGRAISRSALPAPTSADHRYK